jgi:hypothetical protein
MRFRIERVWEVAILLCVVAASADGQTVRVLVYNTAKVQEGIVEGARREATRIFRVAGIQLEWMNCTGKGPSGDCRLQQDGPELVLHIIPKGKVSTDSVYGEAFLAGDGAGKYSDVFYDRIEGAQRDFGITPSVLLGAVAAHEIGHLMLGLGAHSWTGIMAPVWRKESFQELEMGKLFFTHEQSAQLREHSEQQASRMANRPRSVVSRKGSRVEGLDGKP